MKILRTEPKNQEPNFFEKVYKIVKQIPVGRVMTYGQIAEVIGTRDARKVGWALHGNQNKAVPCYRVVNKDGKIAQNYSMGGWGEQKMKLVSEGVVFKDKMHVDLDRCLWR